MCVTFDSLRLTSLFSVMSVVVVVEKRKSKERGLKEKSDPHREANRIREFLWRLIIR